MVDAIYIDNNRIQVVKNDDISFDTQRPSILMFPESNKIEINDLTVAFPDLIQQQCYFRDTFSPGGTTYCELWSTLIWQEWGPQYGTHNERYFPADPGASIPGPTTRNIPDITLTTVPAEANFLDIRARIRRTVTPPLFYNFTHTYLPFKENEWIPLPGGSCPVEFSFEMKRMFQINRVGNTLVMSRQQSVFNNGPDVSPIGSGWSDLTTGNGWARFFSNNAGVNPNLLHAQAGNQVGVLMDRRGPDAVGNKRPSGTNACSAAWPNTASQYSVDLLIHPGIYKAST